MHTGSGCPRIPERLALSLIQDVEAWERDRQASKEAGLKVLLSAHAQDPRGLARQVNAYLRSGDMKGAQSHMFALACSLFPDAPRSLLEQLVTVPVTGEGVFRNRGKRRQFQTARGLILHLCAGQCRRAFDQVAQEHGMAVIDVDLKEGLNEAQTFLKVKAIAAGPPCRTFSLLRHRPCALH